MFEVEEDWQVDAGLDLYERRTYRLIKFGLNARNFLVDAEFALDKENTVRETYMLASLFDAIALTKETPVIRVVKTNLSVLSPLYDRENMDHCVSLVTEVVCRRGLYGRKEFVVACENGDKHIEISENTDHQDIADGEIIYVNK